MRVADIRPFVDSGVVQLSASLQYLPGPWAQHALCAQTDPEAFYPERGESAKPAVEVCRRCPVREYCLSYAVAIDDRHGIFGGMTAKQRNRLRAVRIPGTTVTVQLMPRTKAVALAIKARAAAGMSTQEIAREVGLTEQTVERVLAA